MPKTLQTIKPASWLPTMAVFTGPIRTTQLARPTQETIYSWSHGEPMAKRDPLGHKGCPVQWDHRDCKDCKVKSEHKEYRDQKGIRDHKDCPDQSDHKDHKEYRVKLAKRDRKG